jgi:hypothetical protein
MIQAPTPHLVHVAALALITVECDLLFPRWSDSKREIEIRTDLDLGTVTFYDGLGLPLSLNTITPRETQHMYNYLALNHELNQLHRLN